MDTSSSEGRGCRGFGSFFVVVDVVFVVVDSLRTDYDYDYDYDYETAPDSLHPHSLYFMPGVRSVASLSWNG
jgi:hypothetical protein